MPSFGRQYRPAITSFCIQFPRVRSHRTPCTRVFEVADLTSRAKAYPKVNQAGRKRCRAKRPAKFLQKGPQASRSMHRAIFWLVDGRLVANVTRAAESGIVTSRSHEGCAIEAPRRIKPAAFELERAAILPKQTGRWPRQAVRSAPCGPAAWQAFSKLHACIALSQQSLLKSPVHMAGIANLSISKGCSA